VDAAPASALVPEPVTHEAQTEFVSSKAYPVAQLEQAKAKVATLHSPQLATSPVYVNDAVFTPVAQLTQTLFPESHSVSPRQLVQAKVAASNILVPPTTAAATVHALQSAVNPEYVFVVAVAPAVVNPVMHEIHCTASESK